jgi:hypothetical protein
VTPTRLTDFVRCDILSQFIAAYYATFSVMLLAYLDKWSAANATLEGAIIAGAFSINAGNAFGSKSQTSPLGPRCSTNHPGKTTTPRTKNRLPVKHPASLTVLPLHPCSGVRHSVALD